MERQDLSRRKYPVWALAAFLILSAVPILMLGVYARASLDDYSYGLRTYQALTLGTSLPAAVWRTVSGYYMNWQGSFSGMTLMTLTPSIFGERAYWITPVVMLSSLSIGTLKLTDTVVRRFLGGNRYDALGVSLPVLFLCIQCVPSPQSAFFWWNGAVYYTFFYGMMLLLLDRFCVLAAAETNGERRKAFFTALPFAVLVGGSNYATALLSLLLSGFFLLWFFLRRRAAFFRGLGISALLAAAFLVSVLAPGNGVRQAYEEVMAPLEAASESISQAFSDLSGFYHPLIGLTLVLLIPWIWPLTKKTSFRFPWPAAFTALSFLLFAAQNAPAFYAMSDAGPDRLRNIVFYSYVLLLPANEWYWLGWLRRILSKREAGKTARGAYIAAACLLAAVLVSGNGFENLTGVRSAEALADGSAETYARERDARMAVLLDDGKIKITLQPIRTRPSLLYVGDVTRDPTDWRNQAVAWYFGKERVTLAS